MIADKSENSTHRVAHAQEAVVVDDARSSKRVGGGQASKDGRDDHGGRGGNLGLGGLLGRTRHVGDVSGLGVLGGREVRFEVGRVFK